MADLEAGSARLTTSNQSPGKPEPILRATTSYALDHITLPGKKCSDIHGLFDLYIYLKQNRRAFVAVAIFLSTFVFVMGIFVLYMLEIYEDTCYIAAGAFGIISSVYGLFHFRTILGLKREIDEFSKRNRQFRRENHELQTEIRRFKQTHKELQVTRSRIREAIKKKKVNLGKFRTLNDNIEATGKETVGLLGDLNRMADKMESKWKEQLIQKERKILNICYDRFQKDGDDGMTNKDFMKFKETLPLSYQLRLMQQGLWGQIAGPDGVMQMNQFRKVLDQFTEEEVERDFQRRRTERQRTLRAYKYQG